jgi:hypothetical protein
MSRVVGVAVFVWGMLASGRAQDPAKPADSSKGTTIIGCLAGPDADDHYTLTSMQHRLGVDVVGGDELKQGAGAKVKLTGTWQPMPGASAKTGDATQQFKATQVAVLEAKCQAPQALTPVSKNKKQQQKK